jgi:transcription elongation factor Elf1
MDDAVEVSCPYCGEPSTVSVGADEEDEEFVQDCPVCCRPWKVRIRIRRDGTAEVSVVAEGE